MKLDFNKGKGLLPAIVQDAKTNKVLMLGYMNEAAYKETKKSGKVTFFSRSKNRLWTKGESSGNFLKLVEIRQDCDADTLLIKAKPKGPVCHTGADTCFEESNQGGELDFLLKLAEIIRKRRKKNTEGSYTHKLFQRGINKIAQKVGEEAVELVIEAKDDDMDLFLNEAADLMFHLMVLLEAKDTRLEAVVDILAERHK